MRFDWFYGLNQLLYCAVKMQLTRLHQATMSQVALKTVSSFSASPQCFENDTESRCVFGSHI